MAKKIPDAVLKTAADINRSTSWIRDITRPSSLNISGIVQRQLELNDRNTFRNLNDILRPLDLGVSESLRRQLELIDRSTYSSMNDILKNIDFGISGALQKQIDLIGQTTSAKTLNDVLNTVNLGINDAFQKQIELLDRANSRTLDSILKTTHLGVDHAFAKNSENFRSSFNQLNSIDHRLKESLSSIQLEPALMEAIQRFSVSATANFDVSYEGNLTEDIASGWPDSISDYLQQLPEKARCVFIWIFINVISAYVILLITDITVGVVSDRVKPHVSNYLFGRPQATNKTISNLSRTMSDVQFQYIRFVAVDSLRVWSTPSSKGEILDVLPHGDVVTLIQKDATFSWSQIRYKNQDGDLIEGWVFSRYLHSFKMR